MRRAIETAAAAAAVLAVACATRVPVVTDPSYPDFLFPTVPHELSGSNSAPAHRAAWAYLQLGELATAATRYQRLLQQASEFYPAEAGLGWVSLALGKEEAAVVHFSGANEANPGYVPALVGLGEAYLALDQSEAALASFEAALGADSSLVHLRQTVEELRFTVVSEQIVSARVAAADGRYTSAVAAYHRILESSPESGFLHMELGRLERLRGDTAGALEHAREAIELDPFDGDALVLEGELLEGLGDLDGALVSYERADAVISSEESTERVTRVREVIRMAELPVEVREISGKPEVTRGDLAALLGLQLADLLAEGAGQSVIITDTREHWSREWIRTVTDAGVMRVDAAYRFDPSRPVRRGELAEVVAATLDLIEEQSGRAVDVVAESRLADMRPSHLSHAAATRAVASGILDLFEKDTFQPARTVTGSEASVVSDRLAALTRNER